MPTSIFVTTSQQIEINDFSGFNFYFEFQEANIRNQDFPLTLELSFGSLYCP